MYAIVTTPEPGSPAARSDRTGFHAVRSSGLSDDTIDMLEARALPYGSAFDRFVGARSIKMFPVDEDRFALSLVEIPARNGNAGEKVRGIPYSECLVLPYTFQRVVVGLPVFGYDLLFGHPEQAEDILDRARADADERPAASGSLLRQMRSRFGRSRVVTVQYRDPSQWREVEEAARATVSRLSDNALRKMSFVTLSLSADDPMKLVVYALPGATPVPPAPVPEPVMLSPEVVVRTYFERLLSQRDLSACDELLAEDYLEHDEAAGAPRGREASRAFVADLLSHQPDLRFVIEQAVELGDHVSILATWRAIHDQTGAVVDRRELLLLRVNGSGQISERRSVLLPPPAGT